MSVAPVSPDIAKDVAVVFLVSPPQCGLFSFEHTLFSLPHLVIT